MPPDSVGRETAGDGARRRSVQSPASSSTSLSARSESAGAGPHRGVSSSDSDAVTASEGHGDALSTGQAKTKTPSPRPSILSRFNLPLPLRSRNRNVVDFHVRCDEPHKNYSAGDSVRGAAVLVVVKPVRITHLVVSLHGYVRVLRDPTSVAKAQGVTVVPPPGSSKRPRYQGNGLASLFQDEQVLSGEGRIEPGKYEFGFDLMFPDKRLPSSIDFERGTIAYTITATLTRPTTMSPTSTCDRRVTLVQEIDVGMLSPPRPRTIFLEPISKRTRRRKAQVVDKSSTSLGTDANDMASDPDGSVATEDSGREGHNESRGVGGSGPSDLRSEISGESGRSGSTAMSSGRADFAQLSQVGSTLTSSAKQQVVDDKTITATIELLRGGCLPGETVPVRVTVQHIKRMKSMTGVIVTLFRQGKIDSSPAASLFARDTSGRNPYVLEQPSDSAYPRSRTGLGGLSLSSTSSTSMFRKDLDQNAAPLIIDPATLQASVTVSVRLPDDAFPTIKGVPGDMISFKYQVEVIVDLGGRLSAQLQGGSQSMSRVNPNGTGSSEQSANPFTSQRGSNLADTSQVRRHKGVISVSLETIVGTTDSSKVRIGAPGNGMGKTRTIRIADREDDEIIRPEAPTQMAAHPNGHTSQHRLPTESDPLDYTSPPPHPSDAPQASWSAGSSRVAGHTHTNGMPSGAAPSYIPPPQLPDEASMTEKERIRHAETRLLPSQPPAAAGPSSSAGASASASVSPSAPLGGYEDDIYGAEDTPRLRPATSPAPAAASVDDADGPSAPTVEEVTAGRPADDKQELERRRLMEEASAPPEFPEDMQSGVRSSQDEAAQREEPSAPALDVDDEYEGYGVGAGPSGQGASSSANEQLPAYER